MSVRTALRMMVVLAVLVLAVFAGAKLAGADSGSAHGSGPGRVSSVGESYRTLFGVRQYVCVAVALAEGRVTPCGTVRGSWATGDGVTVKWATRTVDGEARLVIAGLKARR